MTAAMRESQAISSARSWPPPAGAVAEGLGGCPALFAATAARNQAASATARASWASSPLACVSRSAVCSTVGLP